ncbi:TatD family hydrolase, partial [Acinetobacter baumannii]|nr:TatD family hydrolase [Acinetobacter baumannii]
NSAKLPEIVAKIPLDRLLLETDCPYLAPVPNRGKRNEPANIKYIAQKVADIRNLSIEEVGRQTTQNAIELFDLK